MTLADGTDGGGITIEFFDFEGSSIADFNTWLTTTAQPNTKDKPYDVKLNLSTLGTFYELGTTYTELASILKKTSPSIYVKLDLSGSSFTSLIGNAFSQCPNLISITLPNSIQTIGERAFYVCGNLKNITIPNNVTSIEAQTFEQCSSLTSVNLGNGVKTIGADAFRVCGFTSITIPASVTSIGISAFAGCASLTSVTFNTNTVTIDDITFPAGTGGLWGSPALKTAYAVGGAGTYKWVNNNWSKQ